MPIRATVQQPTTHNARPPSRTHQLTARTHAPPLTCRWLGSSEQYSEEALSLNSSFVVWMTHSGTDDKGEGGLSIPNPPASHWVTSLSLLLVVIHAGHRMGLDLCYLDIRSINIIQQATFTLTISDGPYECLFVKEKFKV